MGDAAEMIQDFIDKNPAAASFYGGNSKKISPNDIKDQIYALNDATKVFINSHFSFQISLSKRLILFPIDCRSQDNHTSLD